MIDDGFSTPTTSEQRQVERDVNKLYQELWAHWELHPEDLGIVSLNRMSHSRFIRGALGSLPSGFSAMEASRPWIAYWATHSLNLLEAPLRKDMTFSHIVRMLSACQSDTGGFSGGPYQLPHLAPTYAASATLVSIGTEEAWLAVDRPKMWEFLSSMCMPPSKGGGMSVHTGGEVDIRSCYLAVATAHMLGFDAKHLAAKCGMVDYIRRCQTYEGGLGGEPGNEAHGGYTYCGLAALLLLDATSALNISQLCSWAIQRQSWMEGGFNGRTNKLADGCYSFWQGSLFPLMAMLPAAQGIHASGPQLHSGAYDKPGRLLIPALPEALQVSSTMEETACDLLAHSVAALDAETHRSGDNEVQDDGFDTPLDHYASCKEHTKRVASSASVATQSSGGVSTLVSKSTKTTVGGPLEGEGGEASCGAEQADLLYDTLALQLWILVACATESGLRDKPGKSPDYYHTCYCLSGLASSQHYGGRTLGDPENLLAYADPRLNVVTKKLDAARKFFATHSDPGSQ